MKGVVTQFCLAFATLLPASAQPAKWLIGVDGQFVFTRYRAVDPGRLLQPLFSMPTGTGCLIAGHLINQRGLFAEGGIGYRTIPQATSVRMYGNSVSSTNGIGLWYIPVGLRQDLMSLLFPRYSRLARISLRCGMLLQVVSPQGIQTRTFSEATAGVTLSAHSVVAHRFTPALYTGFECRFPFRRFEVFIECGNTIGLQEVLSTRISYQLNKLTYNATISSKGSATNGLGLGIRYTITR